MHLILQLKEAVAVAGARNGQQAGPAPDAAGHFTGWFWGGAVDHQSEPFVVLLLPGMEGFAIFCKAACCGSLSSVGPSLSLPWKHLMKPGCLSACVPGLSETKTGTERETPHANFGMTITYVVLVGVGNRQGKHKCEWSLSLSLFGLEEMIQCMVAHHCRPALCHPAVAAAALCGCVAVWLCLAWQRQSNGD